MKILYVTTVSMTMGFFPPHIKMLQEAGHTVEFACNLDDPPKQSVLDLGCKSYHVPFSRSPLSPSNLKAYRELKRVIAAGDYDVVHTHTPIASALVRIACRKLRRQGLRVIYTAHGFHFFTGAPLKNWLIFYPIEKICAKWTDVLITINSEDFERAKKKLRAERVEYVPGVGVNLESFHPSETWKPGDRKAELGIPQDAPLLLSVGELTDNKNQIVLIEALAKLQRDDVFCVICGEGPNRPLLQQRIAELGLSGRVFLPGIRSDIPEWMAEADVYVHPSHREGLSVATMEAMTSALPVICGDIRGNRDLIDEKGGFLAAPNDAAQFTTAIETLLKDGTMRNEMGRHNREKAARFSLPTVLEALKKIYNAREANS